MTREGTLFFINRKGENSTRSKKIREITRKAFLFGIYELFSENVSLILIHYFQI